MPPIAILTGSSSSSSSLCTGAKEQFEEAALRSDARDVNDPAHEDIEATLAVLVARFTAGGTLAATCLLSFCLFP